MPRETAETETWKNTGQGHVAVLKYDRRGELKHEIVGGGRSFTITSTERQINQELVIDQKLDCFLNGTLIPIVVQGSEEEVAVFTQNPNIMSDEQAEELFKAHWKTFEKKISEITNSLTLTRLLEAAERVDATVKQEKIIRNRLHEIDPTADTGGAGVEKILGPVKKNAPAEPTTTRLEDYEPIPVTPR